MKTTLSIDSFAKLKRESLLDYEMHYEFVTQGAVESYEMVAKGLLLNGDNPNYPKAGLMMGTQQRAWDALDHLLISYSAGNPLDELHDFYPTVLDYWEVFARHDKIFDDSPEAGGRRVPHIDLYDFAYSRAVKLLSMCLLLGHSQLMPRWAPILDYANDDPDILVETLMAPFVPGRRPGVTYTRNLPYKKLQKVFDAGPNKRPALMAKYLNEWYTASRREPYHGSHDSPRFTGYWSWEAAAITWLLDIDDSSYRAKPFYPAELVDYARQHYSAQQAIDALRPARCEAGQPCPQTGTWWTPAKPDARRVFNQGEAMPDFPDSSYGATIWYRAAE